MMYVIDIHLLLVHLKFYIGAANNWLGFVIIL